MENSEVDLNLEYYKMDPPFEGMLDRYPNYVVDVSDISFGATPLVTGGLCLFTEEGAAIQSLSNQMEIFSISESGEWEEIFPGKNSGRKRDDSE